MANADYGDGYPLFTALGRPLIAKLAVEYARRTGCDTIAHGCTGKGNDQVRIEGTVATLAPELKVIAPVRSWAMGATRRSPTRASTASRSRAARRRRPTRSTTTSGAAPPKASGSRTSPTRPTTTSSSSSRGPSSRRTSRRWSRSTFEAGVPVALNGERLGLVDLIERAAEIGMRHGVGIVDHIEDRIVGLKVRDIYEVPAAAILLKAHRELERLCGTIHQNQFKPALDQRWAYLVYAGLWWEPLREDIQAYVEHVNRRVTGTIGLKLFKGSVRVVTRESPNAVYDAQLATFADSGGLFSQQASPGFIELVAAVAHGISPAGRRVGSGHGLQAARLGVWNGAKWFLRRKYGATMVPVPLLVAGVVLWALGSWRSWRFAARNGRVVGGVGGGRAASLPSAPPVRLGRCRRVPESRHAAAVDGLVVEDRGMAAVGCRRGPGPRARPLGRRRRGARAAGARRAPRRGGRAAVRVAARRALRRDPAVWRGATSCPRPWIRPGAGGLWLTWPERRAGAVARARAGFAPPSPRRPGARRRAAPAAARSSTARCWPSGAPGAPRRRARAGRRAEEALRTVEGSSCAAPSSSGGSRRCRRSAPPATLPEPRSPPGARRRMRQERERRGSGRERRTATRRLRSSASVCRRNPCPADEAD